MPATARALSDVDELRSTDVFVSRTHSDYLTRNLVAVLAELRAAVGVLAPAAFARVTGL